MFSNTHSLSVAAAQAEVQGQLGQRAARVRDYARTTRAQGNSITVLDPNPPGGYCAHEDQDFFPSKTELNYLVVDETSGTWSQSFVFTPVNLVTMPQVLLCMDPQNALHMTL